MGYYMCFYYIIFFFLLLLFFYMFLLTLYFSQFKPIIMMWSFMNMNSMNFDIPVLLDLTSTMFSSTVMFITMNIMLFTKFYMSEEKYMMRFSLLIFMFVMSMNLLIFIPNLFTLLLGWDGLGIISFILVIYYNNLKSLNSGLITMFSNRIGDVLILISIPLMMTTGSLNMFNSPIIPSMMMFLIITAAMTKSAQIPFSAWLPAAMAAPTPISALVHSSTLVTAGVYLLIRYNEMIKSSMYPYFYLMIIGSLTMIMAGIMALTQNDIKKIIALSTLSQLGLMMTTISMNFMSLAFFHLITHAIFKALMFICAGVMIHNFNHTQDIRFMGLLSWTNPFTSSIFIMASLSLMASPFMSGFYSKDLIMETAFSSNLNIMGIFTLYMGAMLTMMYSIKLMYMLMMKPNSSNSINNTKDKFSPLMPMMTLSMMSIMSGSMISWMIFPKSLEPIMNPMYKSITLLMLLFTIFIIHFTFLLSFKPFLLKFNYSLWYLNIISIWPMSNLTMNFSNILMKYSELNWINYYSSTNMQIIFNTSLNTFIKPTNNFLNFMNLSFMMMFIMYICL